MIDSKSIKFLFLIATIFLLSFSNCKKDEEQDIKKVEICNNGIDDDGDGFIDYDDLDCTETGDECNNGIDDDGDGFIDSEDSDCDGGTIEICNNGIDDDADGLTDCDDPDCVEDPNCL